MKLKEAIALLDAAPACDEPSRLNPHLTQSEAVEIVRRAVATLGQPKDKPCGPDDQIDPIAERRVYQVTRNQLRPRY